MRETIGKHDGGPSVSRTDGPPYLAKRPMTAYACLSVESSGNDYGKWTLLSVTIPIIITSISISSTASSTIIANSASGLDTNRQQIMNQLAELLIRSLFLFFRGSFILRNENSQSFAKPVTPIVPPE